jgi:hypothetical protein
MVNEQNFDAKIYQHAIKWQNEAMRLKQYCCMLVVVSDIKKSKGQVQDQGQYQIGSRRQEVQCLHEGQQPVKGRRIILLLFSAAITCSLSMYELSVLMLQPLNFFLSYFW